MRAIGLIGTLIYILVILAAGMVNRSLHQQTTPTPTPQGIYGVLLDTNALIYCQIVQQPIPTIFQTATAAPTKTTMPIASPTVIIPPTPTQEIWTPAPPRMTVQIAAINVRNAASLTGAIQYVVTQGQVLNVTANTVTTGGYVWRQLTDGFWLVEKRLSDGAVWLLIQP